MVEQFGLEFEAFNWPEQQFLCINVWAYLGGQSEGLNISISSVILTATYATH